MARTGPIGNHQLMNVNRCFGKDFRIPCMGEVGRVRIDCSINTLSIKLKMDELCTDLFCNHGRSHKLTRRGKRRNFQKFITVGPGDLHHPRFTRPKTLLIGVNVEGLNAKGPTLYLQTRQYLVVQHAS